MRYSLLGVRIEPALENAEFNHFKMCAIVSEILYAIA